MKLCVSPCRLTVSETVGLIDLLESKSPARNTVAPKVAGAVMVVLFLPVHYMLWVKFPMWYHLFFLISLAPALLIGASLQSKIVSAS